MPVHSVSRADLETRLRELEAAGEQLVQVVERGNAYLVITHERLATRTGS